MEPLNNIRTMSRQELEDVISELGQPKFRAKQLYEWLHTHLACSYDEMSNLPKSLRDVLSEKHPLNASNIIDKQTSRDGTRKYILELEDGNTVETVGMPSFSESGEEGRLSVCFSTQVGCPMGCEFCATGKEGFTRNLTASEMIGQIIAVKNDFDHRVSNLVAMGQGEPFLNYEELLTALRFLNDQNGPSIGARHITISTCGLIDGINQLAQEPEQFTLAISLHSAIKEKRDELMPTMRNQTLPMLKSALSSYIEKTNRRVTLEYLLIEGFNDGHEDLAALRKFCRGLLVHVNLLPMNDIQGSPYRATKGEIVQDWVKGLEDAHIEATIRKSRGSDIAGACGQLKNSFKLK